MGPPKHAVCRISGIFGQIGGAASLRQPQPPKEGLLVGRKLEPVLNIFFTDMFTPYKP